MDHTERSGRLESSHVVFVTKDVPLSLSYYRDVLGFEGEWTWGEPPTFGGVRWDQHEVFFSLRPDLAARTEGLPHWFRVSGIEALYRRHGERGAQVISELANQPWGFAEYTIRDVNGYHIQFAEPSAPDPARSEKKQAPAGVLIEERQVTAHELGELFDSVGWTRLFNMEAAPQALNGSLCSFVACQDQRLIGMTRVTGDGAFAFYIQDVIVRPEMQRRGVGTALMAAAMNWIDRNAPPRSFVGLFTRRSLAGFYAQFGFQGPERSFYGMAVLR